MNILKRYIKQANKRREKYAYILINLYDYARLGELDLNKRLTDEEKIIGIRKKMSIEMKLLN